MLFSGVGVFMEDFNKKLIVEVWPGKPIKIVDPVYKYKELIWYGELMTTSASGLVEEYSIEPDVPIRLDQYLNVLGAKIDELVEDGWSECGVRIYIKE